jgi:hypothetical protein
MRTWTPEDDRFLLANIKLLKVKEMAESLGFGLSTIERKLKRLDLRRTIKEEYEVKYPEVFNNWNKDSAYWIGYIVADGSLNPDNGIDIKLAEKDKDILERFKEFTGVTKRIKPYKPTNSLRLNFACKPLCDDLKKLGVEHSKSFTNTLVTCPDKYFWHFTRGYSDGDGGIYRRKNGDFYARLVFGLPSISQRDWFIDELNKRDFKVKYYEQHHTFTIEMGGKRALKYATYLYSDSTNLRLERKYRKFKQV